MLTGRDGKRLPDFMIVGAARCGTTSLFRYLDAHPDVYMPEQKEPNYFAFSPAPWAAGHGKFGFSGKGKVTDYGDYCRLFAPASPTQVAGEASITYLPLWRETVTQIYGDYRTPRKVKIIIMLRDPVDRAISHYLTHKRAGVEDLVFEEAITPTTVKRRLASGYQITWDYLSLGLYSESVKSYLDNFDDVRVVDFRTFSANTRFVVEEICRFLGVEGYCLMKTTRIHNRSGVERNRFMKQLNRLVFTHNPVRRICARSLPVEVKQQMLAIYSRYAFRECQPNRRVPENIERLYEEDQASLKHVLREHGSSVIRLA